jgi:opacity protein-like surface antigen
MLDTKDDIIYTAEGEKYTFDRAHRGWIADFDLNISGNHNNRVYWGFTVGIHSVKYKGYSEYSEWLVSTNGQSIGGVSFGDERKITGTGYDVKAGLIFRPVEESPFRIGLAISTPTWYELTSENNTAMVNQSDMGRWNDGDTKESYKFQYTTPWKFGVSLGHTVGTSVAIGAGYEYSDYGASKNKIIDGYDAYDVAQSSVDGQMKRNTEQVMKGVHTLKAGVEIKPDPTVAIRLGYNYVSAAYNKEGERDMTLDTPGVMYASTSDYTNWKDTHRFTFGLGYKAGPMNIDLAYQYNAMNGDFHPMQNYGGYAPSVTSVSNKRHQVLLTLGYTF